MVDPTVREQSARTRTSCRMPSTPRLECRARPSGHSPARPFSFPWQGASSAPLLLVTLGVMAHGAGLRGTAACTITMRAAARAGSPSNSRGDPPARRAARSRSASRSRSSARMKSTPPAGTATRERASFDSNSGPAVFERVTSLWTRGPRSLRRAHALRRLVSRIDPRRWQEFAVRYRRELQASEARATLKDLARRATTGTVTLVYGARDEEHNNAVVLRSTIKRRARSRARDSS